MLRAPLRGRRLQLPARLHPRGTPCPGPPRSPRSPWEQRSPSPPPGGARDTLLATPRGRARLPSARGRSRRLLPSSSAPQLLPAPQPRPLPLFPLAAARAQSRVPRCDPSSPRTRPSFPPGPEFKKCNMARGCLCCLKYMMFLFNLMFWLCGCGLLGVGIWLSVSQGNFATFSPSFPSFSAANLVIAIGTIIMVTGFLGCLGAIKENKCLLLSFFIILLIILLAELILLILFFVYMDKVNENAKKDLKEGLQLYNTENNVGLKNAWNIIQAEMHCCGVTDYTDWFPVLGTNVVPDRCCMENSQDCGRNSTDLVWKTILGMAFSMTLFQQIHRTGKKYDA
ncbi:tetraspanin-9 isoform X4 [Chrysemys picta bellii]|uniref:tetraspanin-9 isoform X4 n=1 Tax=Chrysemys picta bellii TaxID=8478 RepID=UPI0032B2E894